MDKNVGGLILLGLGIIGYQSNLGAESENKTVAVVTAPKKMTYDFTALAQASTPEAYGNNPVIPEDYAGNYVAPGTIYTDWDGTKYYWDNTKLAWINPITGLTLGGVAL